MHKSKHLLILLIFTGLLAGFFWTDSRYPALNEKALMGSETNLSGIGFNSVIDIDPDDPLLTQILYTTINWADTNRQGMTFGILFAALILTLFPFFNGIGNRGRFQSSLIGSIMGAPLGVCVNCATPIAKGILSGGGRLETMLATLTSSPTMNIIVLTMMISLLPFYMVAIKVILTLVFILLAIPLLSRFAPACLITPITEDSDHSSTTIFHTSLPQNSVNSNWLEALIWVIRHGMKNLWFIVKTTVPLMFLAGFLGASVITIFPFQSLSTLLPDSGNWMSFLWMGGLVIFGIFLPVPMAFDVIITLVLLKAGLQVQYAMVLLFTLGIFSIYPFLVIWRDVSRKTALGIVGVLMGLGMIAGLAAHTYYQWDIEIQKDIIAKAFNLSGPGIKSEVFSGTESSDSEMFSVPSLQQETHAKEAAHAATPENISISAMTFSPKQGTSETLFSRFDGERFGLAPPVRYSLLKTISPFTELRGIAAGDVHNDGWIDLVICTDSGMYLYANDHGKRFVMQQLDIADFKETRIFNRIKSQSCCKFTSH